jgi:D-alanyl-lipoteichoic acid acyltransferase DltB (MBOAT superfamily)
VVWRQLIILAANLVFVASFFNSPTDSWALISFLVLGYICLASTFGKTTSSSYGACVILIVGYFILLKQYIRVEQLDSFYRSFSVLGLSYILFRVLQLVIDAGQGMLERRPSPLGFLAYVLFFPAFLSGPIHRYEDFDEALKADATQVGDNHGNYTRLLNGLCKVLILAPIIQQLFLAAAYHVYPGQTPVGAARLFTDYHVLLPVAVALAAPLYTVYLYLNFSGYTDIAIAVALFFGIALPENFNRPFTARNVAEFWSRWHISLSTWFKTYVFNPMVGRLSSLFPRRALAPAIAVATLFLSFLIIGLWHGSTGVYLFYGIYLGAAAALHRTYQLLMTGALGRNRYRSLGQNLVYAELCHGLTFTYFATALTCFWLNADQLVNLNVALGLRGDLAAFSTICLAASLILPTIDLALRLAKTLWTLRPASFDSNLATQARLVLQALMILFFGSLFNSAPGFVYQVF